MNNFCFDVSHLKEKRAIYLLVKDICALANEDIENVLSARRKKFDDKTEKEAKMTRFPAPGFEP